MKKFSNISDIDSIRLKIIESCNWSCYFCHNEGNIQAKKLNWGYDLENAFKNIVSILNIKEVHLTGGEPSLNKNIGKIINGLHNLGLKVKMTTNGHFGKEIREQLIENKIDSVNFSLQSTESEDLLKIMLNKKNIEWAKNQIQSAKENILELTKNKISTKVNVVLDSIESINRVKNILNWTKENNIEIRILDNILKKEESAQALEKLLSDFNAKLIEIIKIPGTSSYRKIYEIENGYKILTKHIDGVFLEKICKNCEFFHKNTCNEGFYTIRLQWDFKTNKPIIVLCMQNQNSETILDLETFLNNIKNNKYEIQHTTRGAGALGKCQNIPIRIIETS